MEQAKITQMAEQVMRLLNGGDYNTSDSSYDIREIELAIVQASSKLSRLRIFQEYQMGEGGSFGQYLAVFTGEEIKKDSVRNLSYIEIPAKFISLPKGRGVHSIGPEGNEFIKYIPCDANVLNFYSLRDVPFLQGNVGFWIEGMRAYFTKEIKGNCVVKLITGETAIEDLEMDIIVSVYQLFRSDKPEDKNINANEQ